MQFLEVHHEEVRDLLGDPTPGTPARPVGGLPLRDSAVGGATASGLATRRVETAEDALALLRHGAAVRATGEQHYVKAGSRLLTAGHKGLDGRQGSHRCQVSLN